MLMFTVTYFPSDFQHAYNNGYVSDYSYMYDDGTDNNSYAIVRSPSSSYRNSIFLTSFITDAVIPDSATIISGRFTAKMRSSKSGSYICQAAETTAYSGSVAYLFGNSNSVELKNATQFGYLTGELNSNAIKRLNSKDVESNFVLHLKLEDSSSGSGATLYVYGAELQLVYSAPINKVTVNKNGTPETLIDLTADTVTPETLLSGYTAHDRSGAIITGTYEAGIPSNYGLITWDGSVLTVS